jgi:hypothetical protein
MARGGPGRRSRPSRGAPMLAVASAAAAAIVAISLRPNAGAVIRTPRREERPLAIMITSVAMGRRRGGAVRLPRRPESCRRD